MVDFQLAGCLCMRWYRNRKQIDIVRELNTLPADSVSKNDAAINATAKLERAEA